MKENRKYIRLQAAIGLTYKKISGSAKHRPKPSIIRNISGGGLSFVAKEMFRAGDLLEIDVQIPHLSEPVRTVAEVVWVTSHPDKQSHAVGVRFRDVEPGDLRAILEYVHTIGIG